MRVLGNESKTSLEEHSAVVHQHPCVLKLEFGTSIGHEPTDVAATICIITVEGRLLTKAMEVFQRKAALMAYGNNTPELWTAKDSKRITPPPSHLLRICLLFIDDERGNILRPLG